MLLPFCRPLGGRDTPTGPVTLQTSKVTWDGPGFLQMRMVSPPSRPRRCVCRTPSRFRERPRPGDHICAVLGGPLPGRQLPGLQPGGPMVWVTEDVRVPHWRDRTGVRKPSCSAWKKVDDRRAVIYTPESPQDGAKLGLC